MTPRHDSLVRPVLLARATRDSDDLSVDPTAVLGGEESDDASDVFGRSAALEGAVLGHHVLDGGCWDVGGAAWGFWSVRNKLFRSCYRARRRDLLPGM